MKLWDCSFSWLTLVVRAPTKEAARDLALRTAETYGLEEDNIRKCEPVELTADGDEEVLIEDAS